jgi:hypothetical protein
MLSFLHVWMIDSASSQVYQGMYSATEYRTVEEVASIVSFCSRYLRSTLLLIQALFRFL